MNRKPCSKWQVIFIICTSVFFAARFADCANLRSAAEFQVLPEVRTDNPGSYSFTVEEGPINSWIRGGSFEPMSFRTKVHAISSSPNEIIVSREEIDGWNVYKSGLFDGARVRVYRVRGGKLVKIREDKVKKHHASGWNYSTEGIGANFLISSDYTQAHVKIAPWSRKDVNYYYCVFAVDKKGQISPPSKAASVYIDRSYPDSVIDIQNNTVQFSLDSQPTLSRHVTSPRDFQAELDSKSGRITLSWEPISSPYLAGYLVANSDYPAHKQQGFHLFLEQSPSDPQQHIQKGDMIFIDQTIRRWDKERLFSNRIFNAQQAAPPEPLLDEMEKVEWSFVEHPGPLPKDFLDGGTTCLLLEGHDSSQVRIGVYNHSGTEQNWYRVLDPEKTYVVEFMGRSEGLANPTVTFGFEGPYDGEIAPIGFNIDGNWKKYSASFTVPDRLKESRAGRMVLYFNGPGRLFVDNWRVYESGTDFMDFGKQDYAAIKKSAMTFFRTHSNVRTRWGYTMENFTNPIGNSDLWGNTAATSHSLPSLLKIIKKGGLRPWLQVEMCMDEKEWLGFVEYFCAPYDPIKDKPDAKPWAYKRYLQGQVRPWLDEFDTILFEISNETWNPLFKPWFFNWISMPDTVDGRLYSSGELYGLFQEYVIGVLKSSPYWSQEAEKKFEFVLGGWAMQTGDDGYGQQAQRLSPSSHHVTVAAYNGGWDENVSSPQASSKDLFNVLSWAPLESEPRAAEMMRTRKKGGGNYLLGTYEGGPGYNMDGLNGVNMTADQVERESQTMKSLAAGTATLDVFLSQGYQGYKLQNFFTFSRSRNYFSSHARLQDGGHPYPSWKALALYNREGGGDFLRVETISSPTWDFAKTDDHEKAENVPLVAVYATKIKNRLNLFVLSRKVVNYPVPGDKGYSPVTIHLPFTRAQSITLFKMTGDPAAHNLDSDRVKVEQLELPATVFSKRFSIGETTGAFIDGLPPASTFLYVFKGIE